MRSSFESEFPGITRWVKENGTIEIGFDPQTNTFVRAIDEGGMPWSGRSQYQTIDDALQDLEKGIRQLSGAHDLDRKHSAEKGRSTRERPAKESGKAPGKPGDRPGRSAENPLLKNVRKLEEIIEAIRRNEPVEVTRLTVLKKLCENPKAAGAFAVFLARKSRESLREKRGEPRYLKLANRATKEMKPFMDNPTEDRRQQLWSLLQEVREEQNEYRPISWGSVRNIKSWDLLTVENALQSIVGRDEAPRRLYQASRDHLGGSTPLDKKAIPKVEDIARFWRRYLETEA